MNPYDLMRQTETANLAAFDERQKRQQEQQQAMMQQMQQRLAAHRQSPLAKNQSGLAQMMSPFGTMMTGSAWNNPNVAPAQGVGGMPQIGGPLRLPMGGGLFGKGM